MDKVTEAIGGRRLTTEERDFEQKKNADYLFQGAVAELKILEEDPLEKSERQDRIAKFFGDKYLLASEVDIDIKHLNDCAKADYKEIIGAPIKKAVKKAAAQIKATKAHLGRSFDFGVMIAVNNGFNSLPHDEFDNLVLAYCRRDTSQIDFILCTTVECHQDDFDTYVFCYSEGYSVMGGLDHPFRDAYQGAVGEEFNVKMTEMMRHQMELSAIGADLLSPVRDIAFERNGVRYIREAPGIPDSRFHRIPA